MILLIRMLTICVVSKGATVMDLPHIEPEVLLPVYILWAGNSLLCVCVGGGGGGRATLLSHF